MEASTNQEVGGVPSVPQSSMATTIDLKVVHISYAPGIDPLSLMKMPLANIGSGDISEDECNGFEKQLEHIPNLKSHSDPKTFSWAHRSLFEIGNEKVAYGIGKEPMIYMVYMCRDANAGLPHNQYLEDMVRDVYDHPRATLMPPIKVYGDAYVFMRKPYSKEPDESQRATYVDMDKGFVVDATHGVRAQVMLRNLLMYSPERT
ncbi:hypothetical protein HO173_010116 [Letharia columbiana]|uniref:Uncharacterized protein n=1 Tax=Letharia columbiana TaxID=112416 RepID=A0A8H6L120_9LECA|nr:uncharacterized protein HO173_010116 [Letharia columbiana]KAF6231584.1 hypothetical protein HO173_010116 [Letharia columbiana]